MKVAAEYLQNITLAREDELGASVMWADFMSENRSLASKEDYFKQVRSIYRVFKPKEHPFVNLDVTDLQVDGDYAEVILQKFDDANSPEIWIKLSWTGEGWLVVDDSIFGKNGLIESLNKKLR